MAKPQQGPVWNDPLSQNRLEHLDAENRQLKILNAQVEAESQSIKNDFETHKMRSKKCIAVIKEKHDVLKVENDELKAENKELKRDLDFASMHNGNLKATVKTLSAAQETWSARTSMFICVLYCK